MTDNFDERRKAAREKLDSIDPAKSPGGGDPYRRDWFNAVYELAAEDAAAVPWAGLAPHPLLAQWLDGRRLDGRRALDVGCGLGDNAEGLAAAGASVIAFDLAPSAIDWAKKRFPESAVSWLAADLFKAPAEWRGAFDLVHELYTLQALPAALLPDAARALVAFVAPGGALLVISRARDEAQQIDGPPWPLTRTQMEALAVDGLKLEKLEDIPASESIVRHWRALYRREAT